MNASLAAQCGQSAAVLGSLVALIGAPSLAAPNPNLSVQRRAQFQLTNPTTRLYEARGSAGVVGYPLAADGLPATTPDWQLKGGLREAWAIAFDGAGYLYVSDAALNQVRVYAPGASGNDLPVRIIPLPGAGCAMTVDPAGYVFTTVALGDECTPTVSIYAPVTGPQFEGWVPQPIHTITITSSPTIFDLLADKQGRLYVAPLGRGVLHLQRPRQ